MKKAMIADLSMLLVAVVWGSNFFITKDALIGITPFYYTSIRFLLSFLVLAVVFHKRLLCMTKADLKAGLIIGFFLFAGFITQTVGIIYTTPGKSGFITGVNVIIVPFLYYFITKRFPGWWPIIGAAFAVVGMGLLSLDGGFSINVGDALTLLCAFMFALQIVAIGIYAPSQDPIALTTIQIGFTGIASLILALIFEPVPQSIQMNVWAAIWYAVLPCTVAAFAVQNVAQKYTPPTHASIILCLESVFAVIFSYFFWGEQLSTRMIAGCIMILLGVLVTELKPSFRFKALTASLSKNS
jgi:drug/metabolite transporter (DMT)-like permease